MTPQQTAAHLRDVHGWNDSSLAALVTDGRTAQQGHADEHASGAPLGHTHTDADEELLAHLADAHGLDPAQVEPGSEYAWHKDDHSDGDPNHVHEDMPRTFRQQVASRLAAKVRADFPSAVAIVLRDETQIGDDGDVWTIGAVVLNGKDGWFEVDPTDEDDIASAINAGHLPADTDVTEFADWHSLARDAIYEFVTRFPEYAADGEVIDLPSAPPTRWFMVSMSTAVIPIATAAQDEDAEAAEDFLRSTGGAAGTTVDGYGWWVDMDIDEVFDHTYELIDGLEPNMVQASGVGAIEAYVEATDEQDALAKTRRMAPTVELLLRHDEQGRTVTVTLDAEGEWDDQVEPVDGPPPPGVADAPRRVGSMMVRQVSGEHGTWDEVVSWEAVRPAGETSDSEVRTPLTDMMKVMDDVAAAIKPSHRPNPNRMVFVEPHVPVTPTEREVAIEHVKMLCGVSKREAATIVDTASYAGHDVDAGTVKAVIAAAVAGRADAATVAPLLIAMGTVDDVDLFDGTVYFGQLPDRRFAWSGSDEVYNVGTGRVDGVTLPDSNPRRVAKALAALVR